ncbi:hypothetical protein Ancab_028401 [Ancistrocladus abbreviatus]
MLDMRSTKLENVPDRIYQIQNLQHLVLSGAVNFPKLSPKVPCLAWSLQTLSTVAPGQGIATLIERDVLASVTGLGLCDSSPKANWSFLADLQKLQKLESLKIESQINDSTTLRKLDPNWFPESLIKVLDEKASPRLERLIFDNCNFSCELPNEALTALPHLKVIRAMRPQGKLKDGMEKIKPDVIRKGGNIVILP